MPRRSRTFRGSLGRKTTNYNWSIIADIGNSIGTGVTKVVLGSLALSNQGIDETFLRFVGMLSVESDQLIATEAQIGAFGMIVVTDNAFGVGATAIPGPITDGADDGWFVHVPFSNTFSFVSGVGFDANFATQRYFDFKSKRITHSGDTIALVVESAAGSGGFTFSVIARALGMVRGT